MTTAKQQQKLAAVKTGHGRPRHPPHHPTSQTGMLLLMQSTEAVEVLITVIELWARKVDETTALFAPVRRTWREREEALNVRNAVGPQ